MPSEGFREKLFALEDRHNIRLCVHEFLSSGEVQLTVYRVVEKEDDRHLPIPSDALQELEILLNDEYANNKPAWLRQFSKEEVLQKAEYKISFEGLTPAEICQRQESWNFHCHLANLH